MRGFLGQGRKVSPRFINGKPAAFWRGSDRFLIAPGPTNIDLIDVAEPYSYQQVRFTARAGARYVVRPSVTAGRDSATLTEEGQNGAAGKVIATVLRGAR